MNPTRSTAVANGNNANQARNAAALQRVNRRKVDDMFKDFDKVRPLPKKRDLVFRICTKLDMLSQVEDVDLYAAAGRDMQGADAGRNAGPASVALDAADAYAADAADGMVEGGQAKDGQAASPDMFSIGSRIAGRMEQIIGALHA